jgi:hypothetical protein
MYGPLFPFVGVKIRVGIILLSLLRFPSGILSSGVEIGNPRYRGRMIP